MNTTPKTADISDLHAAGMDLAELILSAELMQSPEPDNDFDPDEVNLHLVHHRESDDGTVVDILDSEAEHMTDLGNARILVRLAGNDMRWCGAMPGEGWMLWDGSKWRSDTTNRAYRICDEVAEDWRRRAPLENTDLTRSKEEDKQNELRAAMLAHAKKCESAAGYRNMLAMLRTRHRIAVDASVWDADPLVINTPDATYNLRTAKRYIPRRSDHITRSTSVGAVLEDCPLWRRFVLQIMGGVVPFAEDPTRMPTTAEVDAAYANPQNAAAVEMVEFLQRCAGYALTGDTSEQCMFIAYGTGGNGKGVFLNTIKAILGTYGTGAQVSTFVDRKAGGIPNDLAALAGARFVLCSEPEDNAPLAEGLVKTVTGQDTVTARFLNREFFDFIPQFKLWMMTNHKPIIKGTDPGIWRRLRLVPFTVSIPKEQQDHGLVDKLKREHSAILRWMIDGLKMWKNGDPAAVPPIPAGLRPPAAVVAASDEYRKEMDLLGEFIEDRCEVNVHMSAPNGPLYASFKEWCIDNGIRNPRSHKWLSRELIRKGYTQGGSRKDGREWKGLELVVKAKG